MEKKRKILIIIGFVVLVVVGFVAFFILNIINDKKLNKDNANYIKENYNNLSNSVNLYNDIRSDYSLLSKDFYLENYDKKHLEYVELLNKYSGIIREIDKSIENIHSKCNLIYDDSEVNKICRSYDTLYEKLINLYVGDLLNHNEIIDKFNNYKSDDVEKITMVYTDYVDYNNDGKYEGRELNEEN